jgi:hypothetical protein
VVVADEQHGLPSEPDANTLTAAIRVVLAHLMKARAYARDTQCDPWEFAVEIDRLVDLGVTTSDLRWLVKKDYVEHAREVTRSGDAARRFQRSQNLAFTKGTCFCLADAVMVSPETRGVLLERASAIPPRASSRPAPIIVPRWDHEDRTLYVGDQIVKEFRVRSPNQEAILSAFQEEAWPHYVDDPLSPVADQNPKHRLRDAIKCLNANQRNRLIRFRGDGTGERVRWELVDIRVPQPRAVSEKSAP